MSPLETNSFPFPIPVCSKTGASADGVQVSDWMWSPQSLWLGQWNAQAAPRIYMLKEGFSFYIFGILFADGGDS